MDYDGRIGLSCTELRDLLDTVEANYALYDIEVTFEIDERLSAPQTRLAAPNAPPYSRDDLDALRNLYHDQPDTAYLFVTTASTGGNNQGRASRRGGTYESPHDFGSAIFTTELNQSIFDEHFWATAVHEVGHLLDAGFNDEDQHSGNEVYSGSGADLTPEQVVIGGNPTQRWSVMARGWRDEYNQPPMGGRYVAFSMEELMTVDVENIDSRN